MSTVNTCRLGPALSFQTADQTPIPVQDISVSEYSRDGKNVAVRVHFSLTYAQYEAVDAKGYFNLSEDGRGPIFGDAFRPGEAILVEATLKPELLADLLEGTEDIFDIAANLRKICRTQPAHGLAFEGSYSALNVAQAHASVPNTKIGFKTKWTDAS